MSTGFERRNFIKGGLAMAAICSSGLLTGCGDSSGPLVITDPPIGGAPGVSFVQPPVLRSENGLLSTTFNVRYAAMTVPTPFGDRTAQLRTWDGYLGGPTLRVKPGDQLIVEVNNQLPLNQDSVPPDINTPHHFNTINLHTHGLHVSPTQDDVLTPIPPGTSKTYVYDIPADHPCGTFWYHAHKHGATAMHLLSGMAGLIIVEGEVDNDPGVAEAAQLDFVISEINLFGVSDPANADSTFEVPDYIKNNPFARDDSFFLVNGEFIPELSLSPGQTVRLRILNASTRNTMPLTIPGAQMTLISLDGITLSEPLTVDGIRLAPANRADIIVRFDTPGIREMNKEAFANGGGEPNPLVTLATFNVQGSEFQQPLPSGSLTTPAQLPTILDSEFNAPAKTLTYSVVGGMMSGGPIIGGSPAPNFRMANDNDPPQRFDPNRIDHSIALNSVIEWTLVNSSNAWHSHHIHINPFQVTAVNSPDAEFDGMLNDIPLTSFSENRAWLDTVDIPPMGSVTIRSRYPDFTGDYVQHCHVLTHEDIGMMQRVTVVP